MKIAVGISGILLIAIGLFLAIGGVLTPIWGDVDLDTTGKLFLGLMYAVVGLLLATGGWKLFRRRR